MIVDDDPLVLNMMRRALDGRVHELIACNCPSEAAQLLAQRARGVDILLTDIAMPKLNGLQLAEVARRHHPGVTLRFISGFVDVGDERRMPEDAQLLTKPFTPDELRRFVLG